VLDRAAAAEPEHALPQLLAQPLGLESALANHVRQQQGQRTFHQLPRRIATADADKAVLTDDLDQRVVLHIRIGSPRPAVVVSGSAERDGFDCGDFHGDVWFAD
jgi:hypothetical protein